MFNISSYTPHFLKVTAVQLVLGPVALVYLLMTGNYIWLWATFIFWFFGYVVGEGIFLHRFFSHMTFETYPWLAKLFAFLAVLCGFPGPIAYRAIHIGMHHAHSDTDKDSHSPIHGFWHAWIMWFAKPIKIPLLISKNLMRDSFYVFLETHIIKIWWITFVIFAIIDWRLALFTQGLAGFIGIQMAGLANCYSHLYGTRRFETNDNSRNNWWLSWITWQGSSAFQNNHHAFPSRYHDSFAWYEFDIGKWIIPLIATKINIRK